MFLLVTRMSRHAQSLHYCFVFFKHWYRPTHNTKRYFKIKRLYQCQCVTQFLVWIQTQKKYSFSGSCLFHWCIPGLLNLLCKTNTCICKCVKITCNKEPKALSKHWTYPGRFSYHILTIIVLYSLQFLYRATSAPSMEASFFFKKKNQAYRMSYTKILLRVLPQAKWIGLSVGWQFYYIGLFNLQND